MDIETLLRLAKKQPWWNAFRGQIRRDLSPEELAELAIKANDYISMEEMTYLLEKLRTCENPYTKTVNKTSSHTGAFPPVFQIRSLSNFLTSNRSIEKIHNTCIYHRTPIPDIAMTTYRTIPGTDSKLSKAPLIFIL